MDLVLKTIFIDTNTLVGFSVWSSVSDLWKGIFSGFFGLSNIWLFFICLIFYIGNTSTKNKNVYFSHLSLLYFQHTYLCQIISHPKINSVAAKENLKNNYY